MLQLLAFGFLVPLVLSQSTLPAPDGNLNIFALPVGQGDGNVIQCPSGDLAIYDLGSSNAASSQFWAAPELRIYLAGSMHLIRNIVVSHHHTDHYDLLPDTFPSIAEIPALQNIYIACTLTDAATTFQDWITAIGATDMVKLFNGGGQCGPTVSGGVVLPSCETVDLCPNDPAVVTEVLAANLGQHCSDGGNKNTDCVVIKMTYDAFSILLSGDFEDEGTSEAEDGPQKWMADFYGSQLNVIVSQVSHHGAATNANKRIWTDTIAARLVWSSGDAWYSYGHPRCEAVENYKAHICEPLVTDTGNPSYCGGNLYTPALQPIYTCGNDSTTYFQENDNTKGFYSITSEEFVMHLIHIGSDGTEWGIEYQVEPATP